MNEIQNPSGPESKIPNSLIRRLMHGMARLMPSDMASGENARAVLMMRRMLTLKDTFSTETLSRAVQRLKRQPVWPVIGGAYVVGDSRASVAICTLTSNNLLEPLVKLPGVAIVGRVYTPNLGIEKIILNLTANPAIRFLLVCGKESPIFHPGQALQALCRDGITTDRRIIGAVGHFPVLANIDSKRIETFRQQIELIDCTNETNVDVLQTQINGLAARNAAPYSEKSTTQQANIPVRTNAAVNRIDKAFVSLRPGGHRQSLIYDPKGFYVITLDQKEIVVRHYAPDNTPAHEMRGHSAEAILLGLLREDLISHLTHAGYIGYELAKAETAVRLGLDYEQDQPLRTKSA